MNRKKHLIFSLAFILNGLTAQSQMLLFTQIDSKKDLSQIIIVDESGKQLLVPTPAMRMRGFSEGLAAIQTMDKKYGFIDAKGELVIPSQFQQVGRFSDGVAWAQNENGKVGFIDRTGKWVINPDFEAAKPFEPVSGMARMKKGGFWFYINHSGEILEIDIEANFDFSEGLAVAEKGELRGYINNEGKWVVEPTLQEARKFENGYARVKLKNKWGLIDKTGNWVVDAAYEVIKDVEPLE